MMPGVPPHRPRGPCQRWSGQRCPESTGTPHRTWRPGRPRPRGRTGRNVWVDTGGWEGDMGYE